MTTTMTAAKLTLTKLVVTAAADLGNGETRTFEALALPTGEAVVPGESTNDSWYASREQIEACGTDAVTGIEEDGEVEWTEEQVRESIAGAAREFGRAAIPASLHRYLAARPVHCHGCGDSLTSEAATWHSGEPYCQGCDDAPAAE